MTFLISKKIISVIAFLSYISLSLYIINIYYQFGAEISSLNNGGILAAYTSSKELINGTLGGCTGIWSCSEKICELSDLPTYNYIYFQTITCKNCQNTFINSSKNLWALTFKSSQITLYLLIFGLIFEVISLILFLNIKLTFLDKKYKYIFTSFIISSLLFIFGSTLSLFSLIFQYTSYNHNRPNYITILQILSSTSIFILVTIVHILLTPKSNDYMRLSEI